METHARHFLIGVSSLLVTLALIVFALWLGRMQIDRDFSEYIVRFQESVTGLSAGSQVLYHGIQVGEVRRLGLDPGDPRQVHVRIRVAADTPVKTDTVAQLTYTGLTGVAVVELSGGTPEAARLDLVSDDPVPVIESTPSTLSQLVAGGSGAVSSAQDVLVRISHFLNDENLARVSQLIANLESVSQAVKEDYPDLREALGEMRRLEQRLESALTRADALLAAAQRGLGPEGDGADAFAELREAVREFDRAAASVAQLADRGGDTLARVDSEARGDLLATLQALRESSEHLARVGRRLEQAPADWLLQRESLPAWRPEGDGR